MGRVPVFGTARWVAKWMDKLTLNVGRHGGETVGDEQEGKSSEERGER
jgi:hypothetical protein